MNFWISILILSAQAPAPMDQHYAETVYETGFEADSDANYDTWPDKWTRRRGRGFPQYVKIGIVKEADPAPAQSSSRFLRIDLDGGGATAYSPPIAISPLFSYVFTGEIRTDRLVHNIAFCTITFFDADRQQKEVHTSIEFREAKTWTSVRIGPLTPKNPGARFAVLGLHLIPTDRSDLQGSASFDNLRLARLPRMSIDVASEHNLFVDPETVAVACTVSGIRQPNPIILLELLDVTGKPIASEQKQPTIRNITTSFGLVEESTAKNDFAGEVTWRPPIPDYGFYRVRASLQGDGNLTLRRSVSLAIMQPASDPTEGEFGWSLPQGDHPLSTDQLVPFLLKAGVSWVKFPIWHGPSDAKTAERLADFADRLTAQNIQVVGMFDKPPQEVQEIFGNKQHLTVAEVFLEPEMWHPVIDPLMVRLSLKIKWWQFGTDDDDSFIDFEDFETKFRQIRSHLKQFGQKTQIGVAWRWIHETPVSPNPPWDFLAMTESPAFTDTELTRYAGKSTDTKAPHWITLTPLPREEYDTPTRARDLVLRMVSAKVAETKAVFLADPFDESRGLMTAEATPTELFLPWCITSRIIGGARYLGRLKLPNGSHNHLFARGGQAVMVVWSDTATTEEIYLGEDVRQVDLWGREHRELNISRQPGEKQQIAVGEVPVFVTGLDLALAEWRLSFGFEPAKLASVFGRPQVARFYFRNSFPRGLGGTIHLHVPEVWDVRTNQLRFKLAAEEELRQDFRVLLRTDASSGPQQVRVDFTLTADRKYRFSIYRDIQVGLGDIVVELGTWLDDDGNLVVEQHLINKTQDRLDFNCMLFAPGRRRLRQQVFDIGPGRITHTYVLSDGRSLLGKTLWLRVEELGGSRLLNYHVIAEQ